MSSGPICQACRANCNFFDTLEYVNGYYWHEQCYKCVDCRKIMSQNPAIAFSVNQVDDNITVKIHCFDCFARYSLPCAGCDQPFMPGTKKLICANRQWHVSCFRCFVCQQLIDTDLSFYAVDTGINFQIMCHDCRLRRISSILCGHCNQIVTVTKAGLIMNSKAYHRKCAIDAFPSPTISKCIHQELTAGASVSVPSFAGGNTLQPNENLVTCGGKKYHVSCYVCHRCRKSLLFKHVIRVDDRLYCSKCCSSENSSGGQSPGPERVAWGK